MQRRYKHDLSRVPCPNGKVTTDMVQRLRQCALTRHTKIGRGPRDPHVQESIEQVGQPLVELVDGDKEDRLELEPLDVLDIEDANLLAVTYHLTVAASRYDGIVLGKYRSQLLYEGVDVALSIDEDRNGWQASDISFNFSDAATQPSRKIFPGNVFYEKWLHVGITYSRLVRGCRGIACLAAQC